MTDQLPTRIRAARAEAGLTREQMAPMLGVSLRTRPRWESGETPRVSFDALRRIAEVTQKPLAYFVASERVA